MWVCGEVVELRTSGRSLELLHGTDLGLVPERGYDKRENHLPFPLSYLAVISSYCTQSSAPHSEASS